MTTKREARLVLAVSALGIGTVGEMSSAIDSEQPFGRSLWGALCLELWFRQFMEADHKTAG